MSHDTGRFSLVASSPHCNAQSRFTPASMSRLLYISSILFRDRRVSCLSGDRQLTRTDLQVRGRGALDRQTVNTV
jgi:hypothetical protein